MCCGPDCCGNCCAPAPQPVMMGKSYATGPVFTGPAPTQTAQVDSYMSNVGVNGMDKYGIYGNNMGGMRSPGGYSPMGVAPMKPAGGCGCNNQGGMYSGGFSQMKPAGGCGCNKQGGMGMSGGLSPYGSSPMGMGSSGGMSGGFYAGSSGGGGCGCGR